MSHEIVIAMNVIDPEGYARYRAGMTPILKSFGGSFRYDLVVSEVRANASSHNITRVFTIHFPSRDAREAFFADEGYLKVRAEHFVNAVDGYTVLAEIHTP